MSDVDSKLVGEIAARVIAAMRGGSAQEKNMPVMVHPPVGECTGDYSKFVEMRKTGGEEKNVKRGAGNDVKVTPNVERRTSNDELSGVVTVSRLKGITGEVRLGKGAMLTPLAADYLREAKVRVVRGDSSSGHEGVAARREEKKMGGRVAGSPLQKVNYMSQNMFQLKQEMCEIGHRIWQKGFCAGNEGNHSVRIDENRVLCTPTGLSKGFLKPEMITVVDMEGNQVDKENKYKRTSEILLHLAIYKKRPDVRAVIHSHPPHATAFACAGVPIPEGIHPEAEVFLGKVPTAKYTTPSYKELGESVTNLITPETNTVLLGNHGTVSFSTSLMETYYKLEIIDAYCRILLLIKQVGKVNFLSQQEMVDLLKVKEKFGIPDARLKCAPTGCIGTDNEPYLSTFPEAVLASATCECGGTNVVQPSGGGGMSKAAMEAMVKQVTDQIMAAAR